MRYRGWRICEADPVTDGPWTTLLPPAAGPRAGRLVSMPEALDAIVDGSRLFFGSGGGMPMAFLDAMADAQDRWAHVELVSGYLLSSHPTFASADTPFTLLSLQPNAATRVGVDGGWIHAVPSSLSQWAGVVAPGAALAADVAVVAVSPVGPEGKHSLGVVGGDAVEVIRQAPIVIGQITETMPYTFGATEVEPAAFDLLVEGHHPLPELAVAEPGEIEWAIARFAATEIPDGVTLQFGVGALPEAVVAQLGDRQDLGLHSGMIGDACIDLAEAGALTGLAKPFDVGLHIGGMVLGSRRVYDWVDRNPSVRIVPACYSHGVMALGRIPNLVAINSAVEVALDGAINAESAGGRTLSGPGGQPDFAIGASLSPGGVSIIALPSTAARGTKSRIVTRIDDQAPTTVSRYLADRIITEYGVARLRGRTLAQRAEALRAIAHPELADDL